MRIVGGRFGGRRLVAPKGDRTRPTSDMVREAMFSALFDVRGWRVLDLFAGTGAVGLEALSRGAASAVFVERAGSARRALAENVGSLGVANMVEIVAQDVLRALVALEARGDRFGLVFADPPYDQAPAVLPHVLARAAGVLADGGLIIVEHRSSDAPPEPSGALVRTRSRRYGEATLTWLRPAEDQA